MACFTLGSFHPFLHNRNSALLSFFYCRVNLESCCCKCITPEEVVAVFGALHHEDWSIRGRYKWPAWSQLARDCGGSPGIELAEDKPLISVRSVMIQC